MTDTLKELESREWVNADGNLVELDWDISKMKVFIYTNACRLLEHEEFLQTLKWALDMKIRETNKNTSDEDMLEEEIVDYYEQQTLYMSMHQLLTKMIGRLK